LERAGSEFDDWCFGAWAREMSTVLNFQSSTAVGDCAWSEIVSGVPADIISLAEVELTDAYLSTFCSGLEGEVATFTDYPHDFV